MPFHDRNDAGLQLAEALRGRHLPAPILLALPRGGVPVAARIADVTGWPLDVLVSRKLGVPWRPELGFGAVAEGGLRWLDPRIVAGTGITAAQIESITADETLEANRRVQMWRAGRPLPELAGRTAILVDDGIATGGTMRAAISAARAARCGRLVVAVPVAAREAVDEIGPTVDDVVCLEISDQLESIGSWYVDFRQVRDDEVSALLANRERTTSAERSRAVTVPAGRIRLEGELAIPPDAVGVVVFAHGSGSSRFSPRNQDVARHLRKAGLGTLLFDLLTQAEEDVDRRTAALRFDVAMLGQRVRQAVEWLATQPEGKLPIGLFGASTGAAAALIAASERPGLVRAVVSRGGRPDLAGDALAKVAAPTLLLVGDLDDEVVDLNTEAMAQLQNAELQLVPGATHLFEEPGTLDVVAALAAAFLRRHLQASRSSRARGPLEARFGD